MLYIHICCMKYLLNVIQPDNQFGERVMTLFERYQNVDQKALGMKVAWEKEPLWNV